MLLKILDPLVRTQIIIKKIKLKLIKPLEIVKSLKGNGVKPAVTRIPNQEKTTFCRKFIF